MLVVLKCHAYDLVEDLTFLRPTDSLLQVNPSVWPLESIDYLQFWYYLGMFHSAQQQFAAATDAFNLALTIPNHGAVSAVQVEAYKKMILVSLLASGEVRPDIGSGGGRGEAAAHCTYCRPSSFAYLCCFALTPLCLRQSPVLNQRLSSPALLRYLETLTMPYQELAKAYRRGCSSVVGGGGSGGAGAELARLVEAHSGAFAHDKNLGLVKQLMRALEKKQVTRLTQTYLTFSLNDIAAHINLGPQQQKGATAAPAAAAQQPAQLAERYVFDMVRANTRTQSAPINSACVVRSNPLVSPFAFAFQLAVLRPAEICARDVYARLDGKARMVTFLEEPEEYDSASVIARMNGKIEEIMALNGALAEREKQLQLTPAYIMRTMQGRNGAGSGNEAMDAAMARSLSLNESIGGAAFGSAGPAFADEDDDLKAAMTASMMEQ